MLIHNPFERPGWSQPHFEYYKHLNEFFTRYPFSDFKPSPSENRSAYCLKNDQGTYLYFVPREHFQISAYGNNGIAKKGGRTRWFNTLTGEYREVDSSNTAFYVSPWQGAADSILIRSLNEKATP